MDSRNSSEFPKLIVLALMMASISNGQSDSVRHYYVGQRRIELKEVSADRVRAFLVQATDANAKLITKSLSSVSKLFGSIGMKQQVLSLDTNPLPDLSLKLQSFLNSNQLKSLRCFESLQAGVYMVELPEVIVQFRRSASADYILKLFKKFDIEAQQDGNQLRYLIRLRPDKLDQIMRFANLLNSESEVEYAEPNFQLIRPSGGSPPVRPVWPQNSALPLGAPKDTGFSLQWGLWNSGGLPSSKMGADVGFLQALREHPDLLNAKPIRVAVLDFAVDSRHPDLAGNLESGMNAISPNQPSAIGVGPEREADHGTAVAGVLGAVQNGIGVVGLVPRIRIVPIQIATFEENGLQTTLSTTILSRALRMATSAKVDLAVMSWGWALYPSQASSDINASIREFEKPLFLAAGNDVAGMTGLDYPASEEDKLPNVFPIGASTPCDTIKEKFGCHFEPDWRSRRPNQGTFLLAPGTQILSTSTLLNPQNPSDPSNYRSNFGGTSSAAPFAAGIAALIIQKTPGITIANLKKVLVDSADRLPGPKDFRRVNICKALGLSSEQCKPVLPNTN